MSITADDVRWCYRNLLGREPESSIIVAAHAAADDDILSLIHRFITSPEYLMKRGDSPPSRVPFDAPAMDIELDASPEQMARMWAGICSAWTRLGEVRPHHSVLTEERYLPGKFNQEAEAQFWDSGVAEAAIVHRILQRYDFNNTTSKTCVEYGSGVGRVTCGFAKLFSTVHGYDISPTHLNLARTHASTLGIDNILFHLCSNEAGPQSLQKCDFFYSKIVLQHNPPPLIRVLVREAFNSLLPGGIAIFQVPTYGIGYSFKIEYYFSQEVNNDLEMHCIPQPEIFSLIAETGCRLLGVREDESIGRQGQWISDVFIVERPLL